MISILFGSRYLTRKIVAGLMDAEKKFSEASTSPTDE
jgi:hypothetical protein